MERLNQWVLERCYKGSLYIVVFCFLLLAIIFGCSKENIPVYQLGSSITFGKGGTAEVYQKKGWSGPEEGFTWTDGNNSELLMKIDKPKSDIIMTADLGPLTVPGKVEKQRVAISINGKKAGEWVVNASGEYKLDIPQDYLKGSALKITFELPDAASPLELGVGKDSRKLGLGIKTIKLLGNYYQLGSSITFGKGGTAEVYQKKGWSGPEEGFTWTDGNSSELLMRTDKPKSDLIMTAALGPLTVPDKLEKQRVVININGKKAGEWVVNAPGEYKLDIPQDYLKDSKLNITFELPDAASPLELGVSKDSRKLGLALQRIMLSGK